MPFTMPTHVCEGTGVDDFIETWKRGERGEREQRRGKGRDQAEGLLTHSRREAKTK